MMNRAIAIPELEQFLVDLVVQASAPAQMQTFKSAC